VSTQVKVPVPAGYLDIILFCEQASAHAHEQEGERARPRSRWRGMGEGEGSRRAVQFDAFVPDRVDGLWVGLGAVLVLLEAYCAKRVAQQPCRHHIGGHKLTK
jgi:hypothetical protein